MKRRKLCVSVLTALMVISSLYLTAFAEGEETEAMKMPNFVVAVVPENASCVEMETLTTVEEAKLVLTKEAEPAISVEVPLKYEKELGGFLAASYVEGEAMKTVLADLTVNQAEYDDQLNFDDLDLDSLLGGGEDSSEGEGLPSTERLAKKLAEHSDEIADIEMDIFKGYTVELKGLPEGHYTYKHTGIVLTSKLIADGFEFVKKVMVELLEMPEAEEVQNLQQMLEALAKFMEYESLDKMYADFELTEEEIKELQDALIFADDILAQAQAGTFEGTLVDMGTLSCTCPILDVFEVYHEYYKEVNGKRTLVARIAENGDQWGESTVEGVSGDYIRAEDWIKCEFDGVTYDFVNSYDSWVIYEEEVNWEKDILTEFKLGDFEYSGFVLRYVHVENTDEVVVPDDHTDGSVNPDNGDAQEAPLTGDHTPLGVYVALLITAVLAIIALLVHKKNQDK